MMWILLLLLICFMSCLWCSMVWQLANVFVITNKSGLRVLDSITCLLFIGFSAIRTQIFPLGNDKQRSVRSLTDDVVWILIKAQIVSITPRLCPPSKVGSALVSITIDAPSPYSRLCRDAVYYSCLSSHRVHCLPPVSRLDWQQFRAATWNPALPSTLKLIPLSSTQRASLMCARAHSFQLQLPTHQTHKHGRTLVLGNACQIFAQCVSLEQSSLCSNAEII